VGDRASARFQSVSGMTKSPVTKTLESQINIADSDDVRYWCRKFGCAQSDLLAAVKVLGPVALDVAKYVKRRAANS
jgi:hypothetical protein